ncbi:MAG: hypothetical protein ACMXYF_00815 [Candidatus Woesearchaeota archaeon]
MKKRGQVLTEFIVYVGVSIVIFSIVAFFVFYEQQNTQDQLAYEAFEVFAQNIQYDLFVLATMSEGFTKTIELPQTIAGREYTFEILQSNMYVFSDSIQIILPIVGVVGQTQEKTFTVIKEESGLQVQ